MIVVVAVTEKQVVVNDRLNAEPLQGGPLAIFQRTPTRTETRLDVVVVGCYTSVIDAEKAKSIHESTHPGCRMDMQQVKANALPGEAVEVQPHCIDCGVASASTRCKSCQDAYWKACREADPELENVG